MGGNWVDAMLSSATPHKRLADYGYRVRIGAYVWNRDKRPKYETLRQVRKAKASTAVPLLWSRDISPDGYVDCVRSVQLRTLQLQSPEGMQLAFGARLRSARCAPAEGAGAELIDERDNGLIHRLEML